MLVLQLHEQLLAFFSGAVGRDILPSLNEDADAVLDHVQVEHVSQPMLAQHGCPDQDEQSDQLSAAGRTSGENFQFLFDTFWEIISEIILAIAS